jgi:nitroreductase/Pyruvate/2-oxoacid:ferredoxin oxidoreductase delta subunit
MNQLNFKVSEDICTSCGICVKECTWHLSIKHGSHIDPDNEKCIKCYHCYALCPNQAIKIENFKPKSEDDSIKITEKEIGFLLKNRRSYRSFLNKEVDRKLIEKLINYAKYIPSGGNEHSYNYTIVGKTPVREKLVNEISKIYKTRSVIMNNPLLKMLVKPFLDTQSRAFLSDQAYCKRMINLVDRFMNGDDPVFYSAPVIIIIHSKKHIPTPKDDAILSAYNINLIAETYGLGVCYVTMGQNAINSSNKCKKILELDKNENIYSVIVLGYPAVKYRSYVPRNDKEIKWL